MIPPKLKPIINISAKFVACRHQNSSTLP